MKRINLYIILLVAVSTLASCKKFLDEKPDKKLLVPVTIDDYQSLLDGNFEMNLTALASGLSSSDDYSLKTADYNGLDVFARNLYVWENNSISDKFPNEWSTTYTQVYNTNIVLEGLGKIERNSYNEVKWNNLKGCALLFRGRAYLEAATVWARAYDQGTASTDLGVPLTMTTDFNKKTTRPTVMETYNQILKDLKQAAVLLPVNAINNIRPSKAAAYGYLSRTYLAMRDYENAGKYADSCLQLNNKLLDYATLDEYEPYSMPGISNPEIVMFFVTDISYTPRIEPLFYDTYSDDDYRKVLFFEEYRDGSLGFKGSYDGSYSYFTGIATDEMYLTRAECFARANKKDLALQDLNTLLAKRISGFVPLTATDAKSALNLILKERRKELVLRGTRWMDLKRLNKEPEFQVTIKRTVNGKEYVLPPNDPKYALPIPDKIILLSGIPQNIR